MPHLAVIAATIVLVTCGGYKLFAGPSTKDQNIPYKAVWTPLHKQSGGLQKEIEQDLFTLHSYHILGRMNLQKLDSDLNESETFVPHRSRPYQNLLAIRRQLEKRERDFLKKSQELPTSEMSLLKKQIQSFAQKSNLHAQSVNQIAQALQLNFDFQVSIHENETLQEYQNLTLVPEFKIFEKTVEHLSHIQKTRPKDTLRKPASYGQELPAKGWTVSLNSHNQPNEFSPSVLDALDWPAQSPDMIVNRIKLMVKKSKQESGTIVFHDKQIQEEYLKNIKVK